MEKTDASVSENSFNILDNCFALLRFQVPCRLAL